MNRDQLPEKLLSGTALASYLNRLRDGLSRVRPVHGANTRIIGTTRGTAVISFGGRRAQPVPNAGMTFKGEWSATTDYVVDEVVVIRGGTEAGTYICVRDVTADAADVSKQPAQGIYWASLSRAHPLGVWR